MTGTTMRTTMMRAAAIFLATAGMLMDPAAEAQKQAAQPTKMRAAAFRVDMIESSEIKLPAEFPVSLYEDLVNQLKKKGPFKIYREGDKNVDGAADLVILKTSAVGFKEGSERLRQVTTVAGATSIKLHCTFTDKDGKTLLERDISGDVHFFGGNLRATYDFAKKAAQTARDNFSPTAK